MALSEATLVAIAEQFLRQDLRLESGECLLIYTDTDVASTTIEAIQHASSRVGITCVTRRLPHGSSLDEKEQALEALVRTETFDVLCEASADYFYPSLAWQEARAKGAGIYAMGALDADAFARCFGNMDRNAVRAFGTRISEIIGRAGSVEVSSQEGTRITMKMKTGIAGKLWLKLTRRPSWSMVTTPSGDLQRGRYTFMPGQVNFLGIPASVKGTAVIDGYISPPHDLGPLSSKVTLRIDGGRVTDIAGGQEATVLRKWMGKRPREVMHFCVGFNPGARLTGPLVEAERTFGAITVGFAEYPFHVDAIMTRPTILLDGEVLEKDGEFAFEEFEELRMQMLGQNQF